MLDVDKLKDMDLDSFFEEKDEVEEEMNEEGYSVINCTPKEFVKLVSEQQSDLFLTEAVDDELMTKCVNEYLLNDDKSYSIKSYFTMFLLSNHDEEDSCELVITNSKNTFSLFKSKDCPTSVSVTNWDKGLLIDQNCDGRGLLYFMPSNIGKKYFGYYTTIDGHRSFQRCRAINSKNEIELTHRFKMKHRDLSSPTNEKDHIICKNNSPRFGKIVENNLDMPVGLVIDELNELIKSIKDPAHFFKIISTNMDITHPYFRPYED